MAYPNSADALSEEIVRLCAPEEIWLYNKKTDIEGKLTGFKLCIITDSPDKGELEQKVYTALDCPIPYDITVYTRSEWEAACQNPFSFALNILTKGKKLYGKTP